MPAYRSRSASPLLMLLAAAGCVLVEPVDTDPHVLVREQQQAQAERVANALCAGYYACGCEDPYPEHRDEAECVELVLDGLLGRLEQGLDRELDYDPACLDAHAELIEALGCATATQTLHDPELWRLSDLTDRCRTYHGNHDLGEECEPLPTARGDDCEADLACDDFSMCALNEGLPAGAFCAEELGECAPGLWCVRDWLTDGGTCLRLPAVGESCQDTFECDFDGWCDSADFTCRPWATPGQACEGNEREPDVCDPLAAHCDAGTCVAAPLAGQPCGAGCASGLVCGDDGLCAPGRATVCDMQAALP